MKQFSAKTIDFLMENQFRDSRDWYHAHKDDYTNYVLEPFQQLVSDLSGPMLEIDSKLIVEPRVGKTISRIYRDTRFSKDKSLYRDHMWCVFMQDKKLYHGPPAFFFELTPNWIRWGCGYYEASIPEMDAMRQLILENSPFFVAARKAYEGQKTFVMEGDSYKRPRHPEADAALQTWLNRKGISFIHNSTDFPLLFSEELAGTVAKDLRQLKPIYAFFQAAHSRALRG